MKRILAIFFAVTAAVAAMAARHDTEVGGGKLTVCIPDSVAGASGKAVLILPGGGYSHLAMDHEGFQWAEWLNSRGIPAAVYAYPMPEGRKEVPSAAVMEALELMRANAAAWGFDAAKIGVMGSSAGGHLASTVATHAPAEKRPAFQILFYPVVTMDTTFTHRGSHDRLLGRYPSAEDVMLYSNELQTDSLTPRAFIALSSDDRAVPPANSLKYYGALTGNGVSATMHIYPVGGHGWGFREKFPYHNQVIAELDAWLHSF